jgi:hypothetical protein
MYNLLASLLYANYSYNHLKDDILLLFWINIQVVLLQNRILVLITSDLLIYLWTDFEIYDLILRNAGPQSLCLIYSFIKSKWAQWLFQMTNLPYLWTWTRAAIVTIIDGHAWSHVEPSFHIFVPVGPWLASFEFSIIETLFQQLAINW